MQPETFERALHMWPEWQRSITKSREKLGYVPTWPVEKAVAWIEANYEKEQIGYIAASELQRLDLPPNLLEYWEDCLYCCYRRPDGSTDFSKIRRRIAFEEVDRRGNKTGTWIPGNKSLPKLPYEASLMWEAEEDIHSPWVRFEIMVYAPLATKEILEAATEEAWRTLRHVKSYSDQIRQHQLAGFILKVKANTSEAKRSALERYQRSEIDFEGLLEEEWQKPDIQVEQGRIMESYRHSSTESLKACHGLQKKVYDRVRKWFPDPKPKLKVRGQWHQLIPFPEEV